MRDPDDGCRELRGAWLALALLLVLVAVSAPRVVQWQTWTSSPERYFAGEVVVSGNDSYHLFRVARQMRDGLWDPAQHDLARNHPDGASRERITLLPRLMVIGADLAQTTLYRAGMLISLAFGVLFAIPMVLFFARCGAPLAGLVGAALGGLSPAYLQRSSIERVDTDGGNLFFIWLVSYAVLGLLQARSLAGRLLWSAAAGLACRGFVAWYAQPGFVWVFAGAVALGLLRVRPGVVPALASLGVYAVCAGLGAFAGGAADLVTFARDYLMGEVGAEGSVAAGFPSVLDEVHELARLPLVESLGLLQAPWPLAAVGLAGFAWLALRLGSRLVPLLPSVLLGVLGLVQSLRFLMYLAPLAGAGLGALLALSLRGRASSRPFQCAAGLLLVAVALPGTGAFDPVEPRMSVARLEALKALGEVAPPGAVALAPWHEGYVLMDVAGLSTFGDGQAPDPVVEQLIAYALVRFEPTALPAIATYLASQGRDALYAALERAGSQRALVAEIASLPQSVASPIVVVMTRKTLGSFAALFGRATWNFEEGRAPAGGYDIRRCTPLSEARHRCVKAGREDLVVDVERGTIQGVATVSRFLRVRAGQVLEDRRFGSTGVILQLLESETPPHTLHILDRVVFDSNFNQMFVLGRYDDRSFELLSETLPELRAYLVKPAGGS